MGTNDKDLEKFLRSFAVISVQTIVQSRLGERIQTKSAGPSQHWFAPTLKEVPELSRRARGFTSGYQPLTGQTVCVEISLKTTEGDSMVLETWHMGLKAFDNNKENVDREIRVPHVLYTKMCLALRSLVYTSRITPGYTLSRKQGPDNYIICYKIYYGSPQLHELGPDHQRLKAGRFPTAKGCMSVFVDYRTNMQMSQHKTTRQIAIEMKDDHYKAESGSPRKCTQPRPCHPGHRRNRRVSETGSEGPNGPCSEGSFDGQPSPQLSNGNIPKSQPIDICPQLNGHRNGCDLSDSDKENDEDYLDDQVVGAFASDLSSYNLNHKVPSSSSGHAMDDIPFISLLQNANKTNIQSCSPSNVSHISATDDQVTSPNEQPAMNNKTAEHLLHQYASDAASDDDENCNQDGFVLIDSIPPFASEDTSSELWRCYQETQGVPSLTICKEEYTLAETLQDVTNQLQAFESSSKDFDDFVNELAEKE